jgi:hypothetical protein
MMMIINDPLYQVLSCCAKVMKCIPRGSSQYLGTISPSIVAAGKGWRELDSVVKDNQKNGQGKLFLCRTWFKFV